MDGPSISSDITNDIDSVTVVGMGNFRISFVNY